MVDHRSARHSPLRVGIVPHIHWDREWHTPFQASRRLVRLLDELLPELEVKYRSPIEGFVRKQAMLITAVAAYAGYGWRRARRLRRRIG